MTLTSGKKNCREGFNDCMNYEFNLLHHVGVLAKRLRAAAAETAGTKGTTIPLLAQAAKGWKPFSLHGLYENISAL